MRRDLLLISELIDAADQVGRDVPQPVESVRLTVKVSACWADIAMVLGMLQEQSTNGVLYARELPSSRRSVSVAPTACRLF